MLFRKLLSLTQGIALVCLTACANFHTVEKGRLYRSAQPTDAQLEEWIQEYEIKSVLRLNGGGPGDPSFERDQHHTREAGVDFVHLPMSAVRNPSAEQLLALWEVLEKAPYPLLIHCHGGADRTGLACALYVLQKTGSVDRALDQLRFVPFLHTGMFGSHRMASVLRKYRPYQGKMSFPEWVRRVYAPPAPVILPQAIPPQDGDSPMALGFPVAGSCPSP